MIQSVSKLLKVTQNKPKRLKGNHRLSDSKGLKETQSVSMWLKVTQNDTKWLKMTQNDSKWLKMSQCD